MLLSSKGSRDGIVCRFCCQDGLRSIFIVLALALAVNSKRGYMQQGTFRNLPFDEPFAIQQDTDTATPRQQIPIYLIHGGGIPFCQNRSCFCQRSKRAGALLYQDIAAGKLQLVHYSTGVPEDCSVFGHDWQLTEHPDVKECSLCHVRGYCPGCTPVPPPNAQPFTCTYHAERQGAQ